MNKKEILDSLYSMYVQYCSEGHDFISAGESASQILEEQGYIKIDLAGKIVNDNTKDKTL